jgi:hypothetical protein
MPHVLIREADGTFTFKEQNWRSRNAGKETTAFGAPPSFVGTTINDIFFHRGRLGVLCNESVVMTRPGKFFDWWRTTMTTILDDDPIDVAGTDDVVSIFKHALTYNEELYLVSDNTLHKLGSGDLLTQKTSKLTLAVGEPINTEIPPASTTRSILWSSSVDATGSVLNYSDVRELYIADTTQKIEPQSIADHVPGYIPTTLRRLVSSPTLNMVVGFTNGSNGKLYIYQYYWTQNDKLQSAWHRWEIGDDARVLGAFFYDNFLHLTVRRGTSTFFEKMPCSHLLADIDQEWMIRLDRRVSGLTGTYDASTDRTSYTLPYNTNDDSRAVIGGSGSDFGVVVPILSGGTVVKLAGDTTSKAMVFGQVFDTEFELSPFFIHSTNGQAVVSLQSTRLQILRLFPQYIDTAYFKVLVTPYVGGTTFEKEFTQALLGDGETATDQVLLNSGSRGAPIRARNDRCTIKLVSNSHLPCAFSGLQWEGTNVQRGRQV